MKDPVLTQGWAVISINYRLTGEAKFPASVQDVRQAVRWLRDNAATYGLDATRFASWGESSGGYFAEELAVTGDQNTSVLDDPSLGSLTASPAVQAAVSMYGVSDIGTIDSQAPAGCGTNSNGPNSVDSLWLGAPVQTSPNLAPSILERYVPTAHVLPPLYMAHGTADCDVPYGQSVEMKAAYDAVAGTVSELHPFSGLGHNDQRILDGSVVPAIAFVAKAFGIPVVTPPTPPTPPTPTPPTPTPPTPAPTSGLKGQYYRGKGFTGSLLATRVDSTVNFNWGANAPMSSVPKDNFSVRWTGKVKVPTTGSYTFGFNGDDGYRVYVNGIQLINSWVDQSATYKTGKISLTAGTQYPIVVEYYENGWDATAQLYWTGPGIAKTIIPTQNLLSQ
jgi:acetyl esterase/lipase